MGGGPITVLRYKSLVLTQLGSMLLYSALLLWDSSKGKGKYSPLLLENSTAGVCLQKTIASRCEMRPLKTKCNGGFLE
jgi:hypothetical protein